VLASELVVVQLSSRACQRELQRQRVGGDGVPPTTPVEAALRKCDPFTRDGLFPRS
jgi:hypothetical protein